MVPKNTLHHHHHDGTRFILASFRELADVLRLASSASIQSEASMCSCIRPALLSIQYLPIGCAPSTRSLVLPWKNSIDTHRVGIISCMPSMEQNAVGLSASHRSGRLCSAGGTAQYDQTEQGRAESRAEQSVLKLDLFVSVHVLCICMCISPAINGR